MSGSREESPDWLRAFQAPTHSTLSLSSDSDSLHNGDGDDGKVANEVKSEKGIEPQEYNSSVWAISSDSESCPDKSLKEEESFRTKGKVEDGALIGREKSSPTKKHSKERSPKKGQKVSRTLKKENSNDNVERKGIDVHEVVEEDAAGKQTESHVSTSSLPLVISEKVQRAKALVECEGESIDLSGDMGAVGRIVVPNTGNGDHEMYLDLKGTIYKTAIVPSRTFCVVSFGQSEAKIEAIMNDFIQLKPQSNVYEAETMVEGTLEGFSFDSEDEGDKNLKVTSHEMDQNDGNEKQSNGKAKAKAKAEKQSGTLRKRDKTAGGRPQPAKKVRKKSQVTKKSKAKK